MRAASSIRGPSARRCRRQRRGRGRRAARADPGQRRLRRPARLPALRLAAPHRVEGGGAQPTRCSPSSSPATPPPSCGSTRGCCPRASSSEQRLSRLAGWVLAAERAGAHYGLRLPGVEIAPGRGDAHRAACLQALALYLMSTDPACPGAAPGRRARPRLADRLARAGDRAARAARAVVAHAAHAVPVRLAPVLRAQPRAAAFALAGARRRRGGDARRLDRVPHAVRPPARDPAADAVLRAEAARDAQPPRRRDRRVPRLLPGHHQLPLHADHPDRGSPWARRCSCSPPR